MATRFRPVSTPDQPGEPTHGAAAGAACDDDHAPSSAAVGSRRPSSRSSASLPARNVKQKRSDGAAICDGEGERAAAAQQSFSTTQHTTRGVPLNLDSALFGSAIERHPLQDDFARTTSISQDFTRVTSAEDRMFARLLSVERQGQPPNVNWAVCSPLAFATGAFSSPCRTYDRRM